MTCLVFAVELRANVTLYAKCLRQHLRVYQYREDAVAAVTSAVTAKPVPFTLSSGRAPSSRPQNAQGQSRSGLAAKGHWITDFTPGELRDVEGWHSLTVNCKQFIT